MKQIKLTYKLYSIMVFNKHVDTDKKVVFLHGGGLDNAMLSWEEVIELMGNQYDIYAIDLLGYGKSDKPDIEYTIPMYVEFLQNILQQLNIEKTNLVGLSLGGGISIGFSLKFPQIVNKLVLVGSYGLCTKMPFHKISRWYVNSSLNAKSYDWMRKNKKMVKWSIESNLIGDKNKISDELVNTIYNLLKEPRINLLFESFQRYELGKKQLTTDLVSHLNELEMPVLIVNGEKDTLVPAKAAKDANIAIDCSQLHIMKGCKHWPQKERPEEFVKVLENFLEG